MKVKTEDLIKNLAQEAGKGPALVSFASLARTWCLVAGIVGVAAILLLVKERHLIHSASLLLESFMLFSGGLIAGVAGIRLGFPDRASKRPIYIPILLLFPLLALVSLGLGAASGIRTHPMGLSLKGCMCSVEIFALSSIPGFYLLFLVNKAAPLRSMLTAGCSLLSAGLLGAAVMHMACPIDDVSHLVLYHLVPVSLLVGIAFICCDRLIRS